ncbi:MAG: 4Fe-4S dicluster domain-containing protein [Bacilli bacterium]|nr:4Fe-4S dicluster domain-containing protein [Bacilli bacterium]
MNITIQKYDPAVDAVPYNITYEVPFKDKMTLLEAITYVHENCEFVAFDYSCHGRMCGRCSVMCDGAPRLACSYPLTNEDHAIAPLKGQTVVRDLIVDKTDYHDRLSKQYLRIRTEPLTEEDYNNFDGDAAEIMYDNVNCTRCGICDAACPVFSATPDKYVGPSTMLAIYYRYLDSYDQADRVIEAVSKGLFNCIMCGKCDEVCQRYEIDHVGAWQVLRDEAERRGLKPKSAT